MYGDLTGLNALVCGASRGIGRATAEVLARAGARVTVAARDEALLQEVVEGLGDGGHTYLALDFSDTPALASTVGDWQRDRPPTHILVNNSGGPPAGLASDAESEAFLSAFRQHLVANQTLVQALVPGMRDEAYGRIVNIISTSVKEPIPGLGVSNTIRGAVASWAKTLARELAADGITVNNVLPGFTATERLDYIFRLRAEKSGKSVDDVRDDALRSVPAGRFAEPGEIAHAIAFLASREAAYVNGINLPVDGGRTGSL